MNTALASVKRLRDCYLYGTGWAHISFRLGAVRGYCYKSSDTTWHCWIPTVERRGTQPQKDCLEQVLETISEEGLRLQPSIEQPT